MLSSVSIKMTTHPRFSLNFTRFSEPFAAFPNSIYQLLFEVTATAVSYLLICGTLMLFIHQLHLLFMRNQHLCGVIVASVFVVVINKCFIFSSGASGSCFLKNTFSYVFKAHFLSLNGYILGKQTHSLLLRLHLKISFLIKLIMIVRSGDPESSPSQAAISCRELEYFIFTHCVYIPLCV